MRLFPILTAAVVVVALYFVIFDRPALMQFAGRAPATEPSGAPAAALPASADTPETPKVKVVAIHSAARTVPNGVLLRGRTEAARSVEVRAETTGAVISEPLRKGASVVAGDVLCRLDPATREVSLAEAQSRLAEARAHLPEAQARVSEAAAMLPESQARVPEAEARLAEAQARLAEAELTLKQADNLKGQGYASESRVKSAEAAVQSARAGVQTAKTGVETAGAGLTTIQALQAQAEAGVEGARAGIQGAEAAVAAAEKEIDRLTIRAPFGGLLETDAAETGALMQPGSLCATVVQLDPIKLVGFLPETDVTRVTLDAEAGARLADGREVRGKVTFVARSADEATRTFRMEVTVANDDLSVRDGQTAEILVSAGGTVAHLVPASALTLDDDGRMGLRTIVEGAALFVPVDVIRDTTAGVWVTGLPEAADVIVTGQEFVTDGVPVAPSWRETM